MSDYDARKQALINAILDCDPGAPDCLEVDGDAILCGDGAVIVRLTPQEALQAAGELGDELRRDGAEIGAMADWLAALRRTAMRMRNE